MKGALVLIALTLALIAGTAAETVETHQPWSAPSPPNDPLEAPSICQMV